MKSEIVKDKMFYLPTLIQDSEDGPFSVFVRRYIARRGPKSGKVRVSIESDVWRFEDPTALAKGVEGLTELPEEADGNPRFVPDEFRDFEPVR